MTKVFAPKTSMLKTTVSMYGLMEAGRLSAGILLTAPIPKLNNSDGQRRSH